MKTLLAIILISATTNGLAAECTNIGGIMECRNNDGSNTYSTITDGTVQPMPKGYCESSQGAGDNRCH